MYFKEKKRKTSLNTDNKHKRKSCQRGRKHHRKSREETQRLSYPDGDPSEEREAWRSTRLPLMQHGDTRPQPVHDCRPQHPRGKKNSPVTVETTRLKHLHGN